MAIGSVHKLNVENFWLYLTTINEVRALSYSVQRCWWFCAKLGLTRIVIVLSHWCLSSIVANIMVNFKGINTLYSAGLGCLSYLPCMLFHSDTTRHPYTILIVWRPLKHAHTSLYCYMPYFLSVEAFSRAHIKVINHYIVHQSNNWLSLDGQIQKP